MFNLYTEADVRKLVARLKAEYDGILDKRKEAQEALTEENRRLRARVLELEQERSGALKAFAAAQTEGERLRREGEQEMEARRKELGLLADKCRLLLDRLSGKYPDEEDTRAFAAFCEELSAELGTAEESVFNMEDVTSPKYPLDLEKLCKELGLMEEDV